MASRFTKSRMTRLLTSMGRTTDDPAPRLLPCSCIWLPDCHLSDVLMRLALVTPIKHLPPDGCVSALMFGAPPHSLPCTRSATTRSWMLMLTLGSRCDRFGWPCSLALRVDRMMAVGVWSGLWNSFGFGSAGRGTCSTLRK